MKITAQLLTAIASKSNAGKFLQPLIDTCLEYDINTPARVLCFLSQVGHESGGLFYTEELASGKAYEGRTDLGNTHAGDGVKFKGRGLIQITGRSNYKAISQDLHVDFVNVPTLLGAKDVNKCSPEQLKYAALSAGWFWNKSKLNSFADHVDPTKPIDQEPNLTAFKALTRTINGGYNGLSDRVVRFKALVQAVGR